MAKGSHATFDGYPRVCDTCGLPVRITGTVPLWFETVQPAGVKRSYHFNCRKPVVAGE